MFVSTRFFSIRNFAIAICMSCIVSLTQGNIAVAQEKNNIMNQKDSILTMGTSVSMPVVGEAVEVDILPEAIKSNSLLKIISPIGDSIEYTMNGSGKTIWKPDRYGKHLLEYGDYRREMWVVSRPVIFNWWTTEISPNFITAAMLAEGDSDEYWQRRGVTRLHWIGGEYLSRKEHKNPFRHSQQWFDQWWGRLAETSQKSLQGVCLDELYATDQRMDGIEIPKAILMLRQAAGKDLAIGVYCSGLTENFSTGMWYIRQSDAYFLEESYWGTEAVYLERWQDVALYRLQERAVLVISPGFNQSERVRGSLTPEELREEFAMLRRVAPDAAGLGVFNAYKSPELERLADKLIEEYILKPTIHLRPHNGNLLAQNIGHDDAEGFSIDFLDDAGSSLQSLALKNLKPMQTQEISIPHGATASRVHVPDGSAEIYTDSIYHFPETMNPLQVENSSLDNMAVIESKDGSFVFSAIFNKPLNPDSIKASNIMLHGTISGLHCGDISYDREKYLLSVTFQNLPSDFYTLRLLSGKDKLCDIDGLPLDGSGNGFLESWRDHYAVHFRLDCGDTKPVLPLPNSH